MKGLVRSIEAIPIREPEAATTRDWWCTTPMDMFLPDYDRRALPGADAVTNVIVRITTDDGVRGHALVGIGSPAAVEVIDTHLAPQVIGRDAFDSALIWERMYRSTINIGRSGLVLEAISAIDIALWDIKGKILDRPLYDLIGGRVHRRLRAYVSQSYAMEDIGRVREEAQAYAGAGFSALKMRFGYGPVDGRDGMRRNRQLVETVRSAVGPDVDLMADAYMGWDVRYAIEMIDRLGDLDLAWIEEPLPPDQLEGYKRVRAAVRTPLAAGEHEFTRWGFKRLLDADVVNYVQPDVNRMGGVTEALRVWALASAYDVPVIPHSPQAHNAHLITAHPGPPLIEYFPRDGVRTGYCFYNELFRGEPEAFDGQVEISDRPGLGIELDEDVVAHYRLDGDAHGR